MYITSLQYIILMCLSYPLLRMPNKQDMTSQTMENTTKVDDGISDENKSHLKGRLKQECEILESSKATTTQTVATMEYMTIDICLIILYHISSRKTAGSILATTTLFFWKASSLPVNGKAASTGRIKETGVRKSRSVPTSHEFEKGDCEKGWFEYEDKCYQAVKIMNYKSASAHCKSLESELANVQTANENTFIRNLANKQGLLSYLWIAAQKECLNCSQTASGYANWLPGQPRGVSKCVAMNSRGEWRDFDCGYMFAVVCEKAVKEEYTERQLLIALLVPIFSCLTVAISFTTGLLVSSVRRGGQPFKVASRYRRTKKERKQATWDMVDMLRRASLTRRGSRLKPQRPSAPSIEVTKAENTNGTISPNDRKKKPWYRRGNATLAVPDESRRGSGNSSSGSGGNSSLYELLATLNKMEFEPPNETQLREGESIELKDLTEHKTELKPALTDDEEVLSGSHKQLVGKKRKLDDYSDVSFRNMAFRDSVVSVETNGSGIAKVTSVQQMNQRDSMGKTEDTTTSDMECSPECCPRDSSHVCSRDSVSRDSAHDDGGKREETEASKNTQVTVRVDVHNISNNASNSTLNGDAGKHSNKKPSKGKVIWTYSL